MALPLPTRANGQVIDEDWFNDINDELVTHETRIDEINEGNAITFYVTGHYNQGRIKTGVAYLRLSQDITITTPVLTIHTAGASGNTEVDLLYKRGVAAYASLFSTKPKVPQAAGSFADSATGAGATAAVLGATVNLLSGDILRLDTTIVQANSSGATSSGLTNPDGFALRVPYTITGAN